MGEQQSVEGMADSMDSLGDSPSVTLNRSYRGSLGTSQAKTGNGSGLGD